MANGLAPPQTYLGQPQEYYGMKRRPDYSAITGAQSGYPLYALKELKEREETTQARHEEEMGLARENLSLAKTELASLEKYKQMGLDVSAEEMTLTKTVADLQRKSNEAIARRGMEQQQSEAKTAQLISGLQTGVQATQAGMQIYQAGKGTMWGAAAPSAAGAGAGVAAGGAYGSGSLGYGGVALGSSGGATTAAATPWGAYAGYAGIGAGGYMAGRSAKEQYEAGEISRTASRVKSTMSGATAGAIAGSFIPGPGNLIGAGIGALGGILGSCIIVSSCTDPDSYEVNITREFRDNYLDPITLKGYYELARHIVPLINKSEQFKRYIKETLVDRLIDFGEWVMGYKDRLRFKDSETVTRNFLNTCYLMGA